MRTMFESLKPKLMMMLSVVLFVASLQVGLGTAAADESSPILVSAPPVENAASTLLSADSTTTVTASVYSGNSVGIVLSANVLDTPNVGDQPDVDYFPYTLGTELSIVDADTIRYVGLYELDENLKVVRFSLLLIQKEESLQTLTLGGEGNPLEIRIDRYGNVFPYVWQNGSYNYQYYNGTSVGTYLKLTDDTMESTLYITPNSFTGDSSARQFGLGKLQRIDEHTASIEWKYDNGKLVFIETVRYIPGESVYEKSWTLKNLSDSKMYSNLKLIHGGDTYFGGTDSALAAWNEELNMIYIRNYEMDKYGIMGLYGSEGTPASKYFGGDLGVGVAQVQQTELQSKVTAGYSDASIFLQWERDTLRANEEWNVVSNERYTGPGAVQVLPPASKTIASGQTVSYKFVVQNLMATSGGIPIDAEFDLQVEADPTLQASIRGQNKLSLVGGDAKLVWVDLTIPANSTQPSAEIVLKATANTPEQPIGTGKVRTNIIVNKAPTATDVKIKGTAMVGETLEASYTYSDAENDTEGASTYQWHAADDASGMNKVAITGATSKTLRLTVAELGKFITFAVTPLASTGSVNGEITSSVLNEKVAPIPNQVPRAADVKIKGTAMVGETLAASYTYSDAENDAEGVSIYQWYAADDASGTNKVAITGATSKTLRLTVAELSKFVSFEVKPIASAGTLQGTAVISLATTAIKKVPEVPSIGNTGPITEQFTVNVEAGSEGNAVSKTKVTRTTLANGTKKDQVALEQEAMKEALDKAKQLQQGTIRIVLPDMKDEVSEVNVTIPQAVLKLLNEADTSIEIVMNGMKLTIPKESLSKLSKDIYFRVIPVKEESKRKEVEDRAKREELIKKMMNGAQLEIVGRPMVVETNMGNQPIMLQMPIGNLPLDATKRQQLLETVSVYIEHEDNTKELVQGEIVPYESGKQGIKFHTNKFSTFTIVSIPKPIAKPELEQAWHKAYIKGFHDGTFRAEASMSRAEMAAMLGRNIVANHASSSMTASFQDVSANHWANHEIHVANTKGLLIGYQDGTFKPTDKITRAQMATIVARWLEQTCKSNESTNKICSKSSEIKSFRDISTTHWAAESIQLAAQAGIMIGGADNEFRPNAVLTRAEAIKVLNGLFNRGPLYGELRQTFSDVSNKHWAFRDIVEASYDHQWTIESGQEVEVVSP